jgi:membrane-associated phospholipid phosphatase
MLTEFLAQASLAIELYYPPIVIGLLGLAFFTLKKRSALFISMALVLVLLLVLKPYYAQDRPCAATGVAGVGDAKFTCPADFGLPSGHAASSILLVMASIGSAWFFFFAPVAAFIMFSRVYAGVHTIDQIAAGLALGVIVFAFCNSLVQRFYTRREGAKVHFKLTTIEKRIRKPLGV